MDSLRLIWRSLVHHRRAHAGLFTGTALAAAILTGALVVGDSVDHTLRLHALLRLGDVTVAATSGDRLFAEDLAADVRDGLEAPVAAALTLPGMAIHQAPSGGERTQVNQVQALGVTDDFWALADSSPGTLGRREAVLDERLARALGVRAGDTVALRIAAPGYLPRDVPLSSREEDSSRRANFTVRAIATDAQLGRFSLQASQIPPRNFFVRLADLQQLAGVSERANLLLFGSPATPDEARAILEHAWRPEHAGLRVEERPGNVLQLESERIFLDEPLERAALALPGAQGALTYLVNAIHNERLSTPYSFMTAGGALTADLADDEIVINAWLAEHLDTRPGDRITVTYYEVLPSNKFVERSRDFTIRRVLSMEELAAEKELVPEFPGLSNVESCKDWKIGMPMDEDLLNDEANEAYWRQFRQTPKALVSLSAGQAMWGSRWGRLTAVRFPADATRPEDVLDGLARAMGPADAGLVVRPVRDEAEAAVAQATDLGGLFLGMSLFLLVSALILTGMLYAFGMQQRAEELGTLAAVGLTRGRIFAIALGEALVVAVLGALAGTVGGLGYAAALMAGLARVWPAVGRIAVEFHPAFSSMAIGAIATVICALVAAALTLRRLLRQNVSALLSADFSQEYRPRPARARQVVLAVAAMAGAVAIIIYAQVASPADVAMPFFGSGALVLVAGLLLARYLLGRAAAQGPPRPPTTLRLALQNATRRRGRSLGIVASLAAGGFLILAVSSMQTNPGANVHRRDSGAGGFPLYGEATVPIIDPAELVEAAPEAQVIPLRVFDGDDASCLNLNRAQTPRVLGVDPQALARLGAFTGEDGKGLWELLDRDLGDGVIPALVGDADTAMWTLKKKTGLQGGDVLIYRDEAGRNVSLKLVGHLPVRLSVFQGSILVSTANFTELWPSREGFRAFLVDAPPPAREGVVTSLQRAFDRHGLDIVPSAERLAMFHAVEATYLNMFLVLGGIGLLLGASATGVVVLRNLLERRRELALLRAVGFTSDALFKLLASEYGVLLALGAAIGGLASLVAMVPALASAHGESSPLWRFAVFILVLLCAMACSWAALVVGLRRTDLAALRSE